MNITPLQQARKNRGLTLRDVCQIDNFRTVEPGNLSRIERGIQYPKKKTLDFLLEVFSDITADQIIYPEKYANEQRKAG